MRMAPIVLGLAVMVGFPASAEACSCIASGPPCQNYFQVDAVFVGTVRSIAPLQPSTERFLHTRSVTLSIGRAFRGVQGMSVTVATGSGGGDCGYPFKVGESYLVYARRTRDGRTLTAGICSRTRPIREAAEDLAYLERLPATGSGARVFGDVTHWERDLATGEGHEYGGVAGVSVMVRGPAAARSGQTDDKGHYEINGIPPGTYDVEVIPPPPLAGVSGRSRVELKDPRACAALDFSVHYDNHISGTVLQADGRPAFDLPVEAVAAPHVDARRPVDMLRTRTGPGGYFEFSEVPPGEYIVGVGLERLIEEAPVYPRTFYPGTPDASAARVIQIGAGVRAELDPLRVPAPRAPREITGVVVWPDGRPVAGASVALWDGDVPWRQVAVGIPTGADGSFRFTAYDGLRYSARASIDLPGDPSHRQAQGRTAPFVASESLEPLRIVVAPTGQVLRVESEDAFQLEHGSLYPEPTARSGNGAGHSPAVCGAIPTGAR